MSTAVGTLPLGWTIATIADLCEVNPKHQAGLPDDMPVSFVPMAAIDEATGAIASLVDRPYGAVKKGYSHFAEGDVLWAKITPCMENGKSAVARGLTNGLGCGTTEFFVLRSRGAVLPEFLLHFMRQDSYRAAARGTMQSGVGQARVPKDFVLDTVLRVPPVAEQRRIVAKLEELLATSRDTRAALSAVSRLLEQYRQSTLAAAFRGDLTEDWRSQFALKPPSETTPENAAPSDGLPPLPATWRYRRVEEVAAQGTVVTYGIVLPGPEVPDGVPYVRQQDIENDTINVAALARTSAAIAAKHERSALREGDVLLCIIRHLRVAIVPPGLDGANITQGTVRIRPASLITSQYLAAYLSAPAAQEWMKRCYIGMAMPRINVKDARAVPVAVPPLAEQEEIMRRVSRAMVIVQEQATAAQELVGLCGRLESAGLAKAFRGELVPQDPADEPAPALLDRTKQERPDQVRRRARKRPGSRT